MKDIELIKQTDFRFYSWRKEFIKIVCKDDEVIYKTLRTKLKQSGFLVQASDSGDFSFHFWLTRTFFLEMIPLNWWPSVASGFLLDKEDIHRLPRLLYELVFCFRGILPIMSDLYKYYPKYGGVYFDPNLELRYLDFWLEILPCMEEILLFLEEESGKDLPYFYDAFSSPIDRLGAREWTYDNLNWRYVVPYGSLDTSDEAILKKMNSLINIIVSHADWVKLLSYYISQRLQLREEIFSVFLSECAEAFAFKGHQSDMTDDLWVIALFAHLMRKYKARVFMCLFHNPPFDFTETDKLWQAEWDKANPEMKQSMGTWLTWWIPKRVG